MLPISIWRARFICCGILLVLLATPATIIMAAAPVITAARVPTAISEEPLRLYLPFTAKRFPKMLAELRASLDDNQLSAIEIVTSEYWTSYQNAIRSGRRGVYYAAPHYTAWAVKNHQFVPLVRVADSLKYVIATRRKNAHIYEINDLNKQVVCAERALNQDYLLVNAAFDNRLFSARTQRVASVLAEMRDETSECVGFSISDHYFQALELESPGEFIRLQQGDSYSNFAFSIHPKLVPFVATRLQNFLLADTSQAILKPLFELSSEKAVLLRAKASDYPAQYLVQLNDYWR